MKQSLTNELFKTEALVELYQLTMRQNPAGNEGLR